MEDEDYSEEYLNGYNHGYEDCEQDFLTKKLEGQDELSEEELALQLEKGIEEGFMKAKMHLADLLEAYSRLDERNEEHLKIINNQIFTLKHAVDYLNAKKLDEPYYKIPWL